ncbi:phosphotransferase family protein [Dactylosporangium salmoneum]|uniref:Aminoglycoside phosphotransferase domain-containing protein n=1 Tax=Dactylosporangium salmoneum TaxID=53361 RepID=A0ABP5U8S0_9ACTN
MGHDVRGVAGRHLPGVAADDVRRLGAGLDNAAYLVGGEWVVRFAADPGALDVEREARLLRAVGEVLRGIVAVPEPVFAAEGAMGYRVLPGVPLLEMLDREPFAAVGTVVEALRALHAEPVERFAGLVHTDADGPGGWLEEARELAAAVELPEAAWFLEAAPPAPADRLVVSHNDLGAEHVLVDPATGAVTGLIDWSDAAVCDPAYDYGLLLRDLGPDAPPIPAELAERAWFYARCGLIEDLAYGRPAYVAKSRRQAAFLFGAA